LLLLTYAFDCILRVFRKQFLKSTVASRNKRNFHVTNLISEPMQKKTGLIVQVKMCIL